MDLGDEEDETEDEQKDDSVDEVDETEDEQKDDSADEEDEQKDKGTETCPPTLCKHPKHKRLFWIACDICLQWYHGVCVGIRAKEARLQKTWVCDGCKP